jgi:hypothetical protein
MPAEIGNRHHVNDASSGGDALATVCAWVAPCAVTLPERTRHFVV